MSDTQMASKLLNSVKYANRVCKMPAYLVGKGQRIMPAVNGFCSVICSARNVVDSALVLVQSMATLFFDLRPSKHRRPTLGRLTQ